MGILILFGKLNRFRAKLGSGGSFPVRSQTILLRDYNYYEHERRAVGRLQG